MKVYSKVDQIKLSQANNIIVEGVLALQGGAFRGVYTSGVLDCLMDNDINLDTCVGISAGALNGANYISGDRGRSAKINLEYRHDPNWVGYKAIKHDKGIVGFSFVFNKIIDKLPFNYDRFYSPVRTLYAMVTNLKTGEQEYFTNHDKDKIFKAIKASASIPYISLPVEIDGNLYLDGGCKYTLPLRFALTLNKPVVLVTTRDVKYREDSLGTLKKTAKKGTKIGPYRKYPEFVNSLKELNKLYNQDADLADELVESGKIFRIAPSKPINIRRFEGDMEKLGELYNLGYDDAKRKISELKKFLHMPDERLVKGAIYYHFSGKYYRLIDIAYDSETNIEKVIYQELSGLKNFYVMDKNMFLAKLDKEKYPNILQRYIFELVAYEESDLKKLKILQKYVDK